MPAQSIISTIGKYQIAASSLQRNMYTVDCLIVPHSQKQNCGSCTNKNVKVFGFNIGGYDENHDEMINKELGLLCSSCMATASNDPEITKEILENPDTEFMCFK